MISDDAPNPRNGKIIQCHVLAWTLSVPWAGSLAGPWREAPCHYAAGLHHPHQYPIFGASPYDQRELDKSSRRAALLSFPAAHSSPLSLAGFPRRLLPPRRYTILRHRFATSSAFFCAAHRRESWIVVRKYSRLLFFLFSFVFARARFPSHPRLLTLFRAKYRKGCLYGALQKLYL